jgi:hypothetical protein
LNALIASCEEREAALMVQVSDLEDDKASLEGQLATYEDIIE